MRSILDYPSLIEKLADGMFMNLENYRNFAGIYERFLIQRYKDKEALDARLHEVEAYGGNILVVGEPGVGKTVFIRDFLADSNLSTPTPERAHLLDLRAEPIDLNNVDKFIEIFRLRLADLIFDALNRMDYPCNQRPPSSDVTARYNYAAKCLTSFESTTKNAIESHYLFIDDIDYVDQHCLTQVLENLRPLLLSRSFCVVIACRTPAFNAIQGYRDTNISSAFNDSKKIYLQPIPASELLHARFQTLLGEHRTLGEIVRDSMQFSSMKSLFSALIDFTEEDEKNSETEIFLYPFTRKQHYFMNSVSNGNIRQILRMAKQFLIYMSKNRRSTKNNSDGTIFIGRDAVIEIFVDPSIDRQIALHDVHSRRTHEFTSRSERRRKGIRDEQVGNSIWVVILESLNRFEFPNSPPPGFRHWLESEFGITESDFNAAIKELSENSFIQPRVFKSRLALGADEPDPIYDLTPRGLYYLQYLIHWDVYIDRFGVSKHHRDFRAEETVERIISALLQHSQNLAVGWRNIKGSRKPLDFKVNKVRFCEFFNETHQLLLRSLDETNKMQTHNLDVDSVENFLAVKLGIVETHKIESSRNFYFISQAIEDRIRAYKLESQIYGIDELVGVYDIGEFHDSVENLLSMPGTDE